MTFFSIVNSSNDELSLTAKVYTNWAIPVLEVGFDLEGKEVLQVNLHDWIRLGLLPGGRTVCAGGEDDCLDLTHVQAALAGEPSTVTQLYYGSVIDPRVATGFITIEADDGFLPEADVFWGDYFYTDPSENFAQGERLVRLEPELACADLCYRHSVRFLEGGGFSGGTKLTIWNWDGIEREPSEFPDPQFDLGNAQIDVYSQEGDLIEVIPGLPVLPAQTIRVSDLHVDKPFGWFDLTTDQSSSVSGFYRAMGRFSVGVPSWCLPCNPCNQNGPCYEPGHPECGAPACVRARVAVTGSAAGLVGNEFSLTHRVFGSAPIEVEVSGLPDGLVYQSPRIFGIPNEPGTFTITAQNDCGQDSVTVTIGQTGGTPRLTLVKRVINDDGGTAVPGDFDLFVDGQQVTTDVPTPLPPGTYTASEQNLPGYVAGVWTGDCSADGEVTLGPNDNKVCEITNDDQPPPPAHLKLIKTVKNDNGGTATVSDFPLFINGQRVTSGQRVELSPGTYTATEQNLPGYIAGSWTGDCGANGSVTLAPNDDKVCRITNDDRPPEKAHLKLIKTVKNDNNGTATVSDFALFINGQQVTSGQRVELSPGTYTASEQNLPGYIAGSWTGDCGANGSVTLAPNDDKVCRITNDDRPPEKAHLKLIKNVVNDDGGTATVSDFALFINGQQVTSGQRVELSPGSYTASEQNLPGYMAGSWSGDCAANGAVTLAEGDDKVCAIVNDDRPATITLVKTVKNDDGGTATVSDFALFLDGQRVTSGTATQVAPGSHAASEQNLTGYQAGPWGGDCAANGSVSIALGEHKVCEITNDDRPATITLVKNVVNDDGGTATVSDFALFLDGQQVTSGVANPVSPGSHGAGEQNLPGYQAGSWGGDCAANGSVSIALGEHKVCQITNDDQPATITLVKHVVNDDGGTATVSDFALAISGQPVTSGVAKELAPGTYTAGEQNLPGYQAGSWSGDCAANGSVTLALGEHKTCEITNDDVCDPTPSFSIWNARVDFNDPHHGEHHTEVGFNFRVDGEVDGEVQLFWRNGGSTFVKKRISVDVECGDAAIESGLFWESDAKSHHPEHGARYSARLVIGGNVVQSIDLN